LTQGKDAIFKSVCYSIDVKRLIREGYLSPLVSSKTSTKIELDGVGVSGGEFVLSDLELAADVDSITEAVARDIAESRRRHVLVFGVSVGHAARLRNAIRMQGISCETVVGETPNRGKILDAFKRGEIQCITSCDVLTTGFDSPNVNLIAVVRATMSPSLWVQICGRGMRLADGKSDCVVLDYGGNIARHGPIDDVRVTAKASNGNGKAPMKICPSCLAEVPANARTCEHCDHEFPAPERKANERASTLAVISGEKSEPVRYAVERVEYARHEKDGKTPSMRVSYYGPGSKSAWHPIASEWICLEHSGFARIKAETWWRQHHDGAAECPISVDAALDLRDYFRPIRAIFTMPDGKYTRITGYEFAPSRDVGDDDDEDEDEVEDEGNVGDPWDGDELPW